MLLAGEVAEGRNIDIKTNPEFRFGRGELHVGSQVHIGPQVILQAHGGLEIGNRLTIGAGSKIYTLSHHYRNTKDLRDARQYLFGSMVSVDEQFLIEGAVVIKNNSAIGMNCVLLPGSIVPENTWLGVGLVLRDKNLLPDHLYLVNQDVQVKEK
jgi:acetyltransferase-like isoleucine patch superfamily enzyme